MAIQRIDDELEIIRTGRYGEDVRHAIHDALDKINQNGSGSGGTVILSGNAVAIAYGSMSTLSGEAGTEEEEE